MCSHCTASALPGRLSGPWNGAGPRVTQHSEHTPRLVALAPLPSAHQAALLTAVPSLLLPLFSSFPSLFAVLFFSSSLCLLHPPLRSPFFLLLSLALCLLSQTCRLSSSSAHLVRENLGGRQDWRETCGKPQQAGDRSPFKPRF